MSKGKDAKFFTTQEKGEDFELRAELTSQNRDKKKDAVKKVIANMTVGKDVSMLFTDVVNCMQTGNIELKKLVYLYLINYAKTNPDLAILAVNTFVKDASDPNPLIRALAVRTMGCIRVERITEYLCEPLRRALRDDDPYVRKTAAVCVAKLNDLSPDMVEDQGFLDAMRDLICDSNPTVVANAVATMSEISDTTDTNVLEVNTSILQKLLAALNECTEWGQVFILDALARYEPVDAREAEGIIERVTPRLQHSNSAVVMTAVKVIMGYLNIITNPDTIRSVSRKLAPPLVTLLSAEPEIQYVALRNINLIVQKRPNILSHEIKVFFCKYNDPIYVKMEKLEIIIRLVTDRNVEQVLLEFKEYATEVDVDFVRKSVRAIGRCAIKLERAAERCIKVLIELISTKVNYVVQEAVIVIKDIFRKYPNRYEKVIGTLCENLDTLDEPDAKAAMVWIIGEYAERIDNADELLDTFLDNFTDETAVVQLQLLTSTVKLFLKRPNEDGVQEMVQRVLNMATEDSDNPDLRDRGYVYWRLLSSSPDAAKAVVLADKPVIANDTTPLESELLDTLIANISTLGAIYHKPPEAFVVRVNRAVGGDEDEDDDDDDGEEDEYSGEDYDEEAEAANDAANAADAPVDLLGGFLDDPPPAQPAAPPPAPAAVVALEQDFLGLSTGGGDASAGAADEVAMTALVQPEDKGWGVLTEGAFVREDGKVKVKLAFTNMSLQTPVASIAVSFNKNSFGLAPISSQITFEPPLACGAPRVVKELVFGLRKESLSEGAPNTNMQAALKNMTTNAVVYFTTQIDMHVLFKEASEGRLEQPTFLQMWGSIPAENTLGKAVMGLSGAQLDADAVKSKLEQCNVFHVVSRPSAADVKMEYYSAKTQLNCAIGFELMFKVGVPGIKVTVRTPQRPMAPLAWTCMEALLKQ